jgi:hypothetical protein
VSYLALGEILGLFSLANLVGLPKFEARYRRFPRLKPRVKIKGNKKGAQKF